MKFASNNKEEVSEDANELVSKLSVALDKPELRVTGIYGDITEEKCSEAIYGLLALEQTGIRKSCISNHIFKNEYGSGCFLQDSK